MVMGNTNYMVFSLTGVCVVQGAWDDHRAMVPLRSQALRRRQKESRKTAIRKRNEQQRSAVPLALERGGNGGRILHGLCRRW